MENDYFAVPVQVASSVSGDIQYIYSAKSALELLTTNWREQGSVKHREAIRACQAVIRGEKPSEEARAVFAQAAAEARILIA
jgi:hypothetical protein